MNNKIDKLEHFFEVDFKIKKGMYDLAPSNIEYIDERSMQKYTDELDQLLKYFFEELKSIGLDVFGENSIVMSKINSMEQEVKNQFYSCGFDINRIRNFYNVYITNMTEKFINSVKQQCVGYTFNGTSSVNNANSLNELLHFFHSYIVNNEKILQSVPLISQKQNDFNYPIQLRGKKVDTFEKLYNQFPTDIDVGWTDMVSINENKLIMMVRDRGHALSIEISLNGDVARIDYFIPKLCNIDMINTLPGINKVNENSVGATGAIETDINSLPRVLFNFISNVPMDSDMVINKNKVY